MPQNSEANLIIIIPVKLFFFSQLLPYFKLLISQLFVQLTHKMLIYISVFFVLFCFVFYLHKFLLVVKKNAFTMDFLSITVYELAPLSFLSFGIKGFNIEDRYQSD